MAKKVTNVEELNVVLDELREAQQEFATFTQEQVDHLFYKAAMAVNENRIPLAKMAAEETGMGLWEDKIIKNHYASEIVYHQYRHTKSVGVLEEDIGRGVKKIAEPIGVIGAVIPTTNPTSTACFKILMAIKTRNAIMISPHPRAKECTNATAKLILETIEAEGAPKGLINWIDAPSIELTNAVMAETDIILATGGPGMVKAAYSSGTPAIGVGAGNTPIVIHASADVEMAVNSVLLSKTFDYGVICASENSIIVDKGIYSDVKKEFEKRNALILNKSQTDKIRKFAFEDGNLNGKIVGQPAWKIAEMAGFEIDKSVRALIVEVKETDFAKEPLAKEKLSVLLAMYQSKDHKDAVAKAKSLVEQGGLGHTSGIYADEMLAADDIDAMVKEMRTTTFLINQPSSQGAIGDLFNFALAPSMTLGCGTWGNNSTSDNVGVKHLLNIKTVTSRRENMLWFNVPKNTYQKLGSLAPALGQLRDEDKKRAFIVTDKVLLDLGFTKKVTDELDKLGIVHTVYSDVSPDPLLTEVRAGAKAMESFQPDLIIALGGGSPMDAAKIMWVLYEHPDTVFENLAVRFMDIQKRIHKFPKLRQKAMMVCIPTTAGTGAEVTPFAVITDDETGVKYPIADYELTPDMAIIDAALMLTMPASVAAASGIDVITHALESLVSIVATEFTKPLSLEATKLVFDNLEESVKGGADAIYAKERMAHASAIAGMAFANAFLGICHSLAHKIGARYEIPHGFANAMLLSEVIRYNATDAPFRQGTFSQYHAPKAIENYASAADYLGLGGRTNEEKVEKLIAKFEELKDAIGVPKTLKEFGIDEKDFLANVEQLAEEAFDDQCTGANPRYPLIADLKQIYLNTYYGEDARVDV